MKKNPPKLGNKYADLAEPQRQLDFHKLGLLTQAQILEEIEDFLVTAEKDGLKKVLIITGKGLHSKDGQAVIRPLIEDYLKRSDLIKTFSFAPRHRGGEGAFLVALA